MYLEQRRNLYYAVFTIPIDCRKSLGKNKFVKSTHSADKRKAQLIAYQYVASWMLLIEKVRGNESNELKDAIQWSSNLVLPPQKKSTSSKPLKLAKQAKYILLDNLYEIWKNQLDLVPKTIDQMSRDVMRLVKHFRYLEKIDSVTVVNWLDSMELLGVSASVRKRILKGCINFWGFLKLRKLVPYDSYLFSNLIRNSKAHPTRKQKANSPYSTEQIKLLLDGALNQMKYGKPYKDVQLAYLILICAYTGNRVEEICSIQLKNVTNNTFKFVESKTEAGIREVPIHSKLIPIIEKLKILSKDGYLFSGLPSDKYNKRGGIMSKRFSILKTNLGFSSRVYTVHSFRSTLITMLENAGVSENIAADIVGHKKPRITYGLYSGGASIEVMRSALEMVNYPEIDNYACAD